MEIVQVIKDYKKYLDKDIEVSGWIKNNRDQKDFGFIDLSDGTCFKHLQVVYDASLNNFNDVSKYLVGSTINVKGKLVKSTGKQDFELKAEKIILLGNCPEDYPIQPKRHTKEFLREQAHLRPRTNIFQAVFRVRSLAAFAIHEYFQKNGYIYVNTPILTASDC